MPVRISDLIMTLSIEILSSACHYSKCRIFIVILSSILWSVAILIAVKPNVIMLSGVAPFNALDP
jgi:hypothetical protein